MRTIRKKLCFAANGIHKFTAAILAVLLPVSACMMLAEFIKIYEAPKELLAVAFPVFSETMELLMLSLALTFGGAFLLEIAMRRDFCKKDGE